MIRDDVQFSSARTNDRSEIEQRLYQYCHGVDRMDFDLVRTAYHPDAYDDHGPYKGDVDGLIDWMEGRHPKMDLCLHYVCNVLIDFADQDNALCESYAICIQTYAPGASPFSEGDPAAEARSETMVASYRYIDHFTRRDARWRIQDRLVVTELMNVQPASVTGNFPLPSSWVPARRGKEDPSEKIRARLFANA